MYITQILYACCNLLNSTSISGHATLHYCISGYLVLKYLLSLVAEVCKEALELTLVLARLLGASHRTDLRRRTADKHLDLVAALSTRKVLLKYILSHEASEPIPALARLSHAIDNVETRVLLGKLVEALTEKDILLGVVGVDEGDLGLVVLVPSDSLNELPQGSDTRSTTNETNVAEFVGLVRELRDGTLELEFITLLQRVEVLGQLTVGVVLDQKVNVTSFLVRLDGGVGVDHILALVILHVTLDEESRSVDKTRRRTSGSLNHVDLRVVVVRVDLLDLEATPLVLAQCRLARIGTDLGELFLDLTVEAAERVPGSNASKATEREVQAGVRLRLGSTVRVHASSGGSHTGSRKARSTSASRSSTQEHSCGLVVTCQRATEASVRAHIYCVIEMHAYEQVTITLAFSITYEKLFAY